MTGWSEDEIVLVSAIEHLSYCPRQCAPIHIEKVFDESVFTMRGNRAHERVGTLDIATEDGVTIDRVLPISSENLGLQGKTALPSLLLRPTPCGQTQA